MDSEITVKELEGLRKLAKVMARKDGLEAFTKYEHPRQIEEECGLYTLHKDGYWSAGDNVFLRIEDPHKWFLAKIKYGF